MKRTFRKIGALAVAAAMVMSLGAIIFADATLTDGEVGGFDPGNQDDPQVQDKSVIIKKELKVYNPDETAVYAPTITYNYAIEAGSADKSITDQTEDHVSGTAVTAATKAGITTNVTITDSITLSPDVTTATDNSLDAATAGESNLYDIKVDFSNVVFTEPGVYRYVINETVDYTGTGVTETNGTHARYLDVYVKASDTFTDGSAAGDWDIYGYVCLSADEDVDPDTDFKTNGFVEATNVTPDEYYTFNVIVKKTLSGDNFSMNHKFPVQVDYTNADVTKDVMLRATPTGTVTDYTHSASAASGLDGLALIANGGRIKYIGIPCGTQVDIYETNDVTGTTYLTTVTVDSTAGTAKNIIATSTPTAFVAYSSAAYNSNLGTITTTANATDATHEVEIANVLQMISPTGIIVRTAPYVLLLGAGATLFILIRVFRKKEDEA